MRDVSREHSVKALMAEYGVSHQTIRTAETGKRPGAKHQAVRLRVETSEPDDVV